MATKVKVKRRISGRDNTGVTLEAGEPFYNAVSKRLYVGDNDKGFPDKHVAEVTTMSAAANVVAFRVGGDSENTYSKTINNVAKAESADVATVAHKLNLATKVDNEQFYGTSAPSNSLGDNGDVYIMYQT